MLKDALSSFTKATKIVNIMINIMASYHAMPKIDHKCIFEEMTKVSHLTFNDLLTREYVYVPPLARANRSLWPETLQYHAFLT